jgi:NADH-quinone oxidoreductase subunit F
VGTVRQREALARLVAARADDRAGDLALLRELAQVMRDASICGLGQTAPNAIDSAISRLGVLA